MGKMNEWCIKSPMTQFFLKRGKKKYKGKGVKNDQKAYALCVKCNS